MRLLSIISLLLFIGSAAVAQTSTTATTATATNVAAKPVSKKTKPTAPPGFEPIAGKSEKAQSVDANILVTASYGAIFGLLIAYLIFLFRDRKRVRDELAVLQEQINREGGKQ